jgi:hypothetical protein
MHLSSIETFEDCRRIGRDSFSNKGLSKVGFGKFKAVGTDRIKSEALETLSLPVARRFPH